jgi:hypothetical protein
MMIVKLIQIELLKTRRSLALLMMFICPALVVLLMVMLAVNSGASVVEARGWYGLWAGTNSLWCYFMLPLYIALVTTLLNGTEHHNGTWRLMLTLPIKTWQLFVAKAILAWLFILGANLILFASLTVSIAILMMFGFPAQGAFSYPVIEQIGKVLVTCLPILAIQHALSWRFGHIVAPLAVGVIGTMGIITIGQSEYWVYYPWTYMLTSNMASNADSQLLALQLAPSVAVVLFGVSAWWLGKRDCPA